MLRLRHWRYMWEFLLKSFKRNRPPNNKIFLYEGGFTSLSNNLIRAWVGEPPLNNRTQLTMVGISFPQNALQQQHAGIHVYNLRMFSLHTPWQTQIRQVMFVLLIFVVVLGNGETFEIKFYIYRCFCIFFHSLLLKSKIQLHLNSKLN